MSAQIRKEGWALKKLGEVLSYEQPTKYLVRSSAYQTHFMTPVLTAGKTFLLGNTDESFGVYNKLPVIIFDDFTTASKFVDFPFKAKSSAMKMLKSRSEDFNLKLLFEILNSLKFEVSDHKRHWISEFANIEIRIPGTRVEQEAIAQVLSDFDNLIDGLEQLIAKKEAIKMGVMQELLRPKEGWEWTTLENLVGTITTGKLNANAMKENGEFRFYTCSKEYYWIDSFAFDGEAILISGNGANVGYVHHYSGKFNAYQRTYVLMDFKIHPVFLKHYLLRFFSERVKTEVSAGNTPYIKMGTISDMIIWFPSELTIQSAIAEAISDIDEELGALRELNFKYERLRMGIMNQLLTGKTRLV